MLASHPIVGLQTSVLMPLRILTGDAGRLLAHSDPIFIDLLTSSNFILTARPLATSQQLQQNVASLRQSIRSEGPYGCQSPLQWAQRKDMEVI